MEIMHTYVRVKRVKMSLNLLITFLHVNSFDIVRRNCSLVTYGRDRFNSNKAIY